VTTAERQSIQRRSWFDMDRDMPDARDMDQFLKLAVQADDLKTYERATGAERLHHGMEAINDVGAVSASSGWCHRAGPRS
jgi:hypothetical protein